MAVEQDDKYRKYVTSMLEKFSDVFAAVMVGNYAVRAETEKDDEFTPFAMYLNTLISSIQRTTDELSVKNKTLEEKIYTIKKQTKAIKELSTPVIQIWDKVLVLPIIGVVDTRRSEQMMIDVLEKVVELEAECVIVDITGVETVDTGTADHFMKMVRAVRLLGAECFITGVSPLIAQTITHIGVELTGIKTLRNLSEGLRGAFEFMHYKVVKKSE